MASRESDTPSFSSSARVFGSMATAMTGSGNVIDSSTIGLSGSQSVSPVVVYLSPMAAAMSPAAMASTSSRLLACMRSRRPTRSFRSFVELRTPLEALRVPEYTRRKTSWPTCWSFMILKASAANGASSAAFRSSVAFVSGLMPCTGGISSGDGR